MPAGFAAPLLLMNTVSVMQVVLLCSHGGAWHHARRQSSASQTCRESNFSWPKQATLTATGQYSEAEVHATLRPPLNCFFRTRSLAFERIEQTLHASATVRVTGKTALYC